MDLIGAAGLMRREVMATTHDGKPARTVVVERTYNAATEDVWDPLTNAERIPRWFLPVSGDLRLGGHYQLEGNAGRHDHRVRYAPLRQLAVTWEFGGEVTWVEASVSPPLVTTRRSGWSTPRSIDRRAVERVRPGRRRHRLGSDSHRARGTPR